MLEDNDPFAQYHYLVTVYTGHRRGAATSSQVPAHARLLSQHVPPSKVLASPLSLEHSGVCVVGFLLFGFLFFRGKNLFLKRTP